ncbi:unnamed protein product, partial [Oncorhynchus mykiss]
NKCFVSACVTTAPPIIIIQGTRKQHLLPLRIFRSRPRTTSHTQDITMSEDKTVTLKPVDLVEPEPGFSSSHLDPADTSYQPPALDKTPGQPDLQGLDSGHPGTEEKGPVGPTTPDAVAQGNRWTSTLDQFKLKRFFVLRVSLIMT